MRFTERSKKELLRFIGVGRESLEKETEPKEKQEEIIFYGFEDMEDVQAWDQRDGAKLELSSRHVTQGQYSAKLKIKAGSGHPGLKQDKQVRLDWSAYDALKMDVFVEGTDFIDYFRIKLRNGATGKKKSIELSLKKGKNPVKIYLPKKALGDLNCIDYISICVDNPKRDCFLSLDNLRLVKKK